MSNIYVKNSTLYIQGLTVLSNGSKSALNVENADGVRTFDHVVVTQNTCINGVVVPLSKFHKVLKRLRIIPKALFFIMPDDNSTFGFHITSNKNQRYGEGRY